MSTHGGAPRHREWKLGCKVYIGNLAEGASKADIEQAFSKHGQLRNVWVARNPPGFAFVEFEDGRDAEAACRQLDGTRIAGGRIKAEMSHGRTRRGRGSGPPSFRGGPPPYPIPPYPVGTHRGFPMGGPRGHYNATEYPTYGAHHHGARGGHHGHYAGHHGYMDRPPRDRHPPAIKEFRHYTRSRSNSLEKARTARPRTPPSENCS